MSKSKYVGPETGRVYNIDKGERIDPAAEGIGYTGDRSSPHPTVGGRELFKRIFIRLKTPYETLTCRPISDSADFAQRVSIIENWFESVVRKGNYILTFEALQVSDEEAEKMTEGGEL